MQSGWPKALGIAGAAGVVGLLIFTGGNSNEVEVHRPSVGSDYDGGTTVYRDDAISDYWDEIREYVDGTETIEACSYESGNCYDLDADISGGNVDTIYFPNGGYLYFSAEIDSDGSASDYDQDGDSWDFSLDMSSSIVEDAIDEWAEANDYELI